MNAETLSALLKFKTDENPNHDCLVFSSHESATRKYGWKSFYSLVAGLSDFLKKQGVESGDRVLTVSPNSDLMIALFFAINDLGATFIPINPELTSEETSFIVTHSNPKIIFSIPEQNQKIVSLKSSAKILSLDENLLLLSADKLQNSGAPGDIGLILYTSGTTGFPKGVMHTQETAVLAGEAFIERMNLDTNDRVMCILPLFHINALFYSVMGSFAAGATLIITSKFSASKFWDIAAELKATQVNIIAAIGNILIQRDRKEFRNDKKFNNI
jgi:crotonobetaine/carnitine-CoA ligase